MFDGLRRAWDVTVESRRAEKKRPRVKRNRDELAFLPAAVEVLETPASPIGRTIALVIVAFVIGTIAWAWFGHIDTVAVAQGQIIPGGRVKLIQPIEIGSVRAIHVRDGQHVAAGDLLIELDPTEAGANRDRLKSDLARARLEVARLQAQAASDTDPLPFFKPPSGVGPALIATARARMLAETNEYLEGLAAIESEIAQRRAEQETILARIGVLDDTLPLLKQRVEAYAYLVKKEYGRKLALLELQEQQVEKERRITVERKTHLEAAAAIRVLERRQAERMAGTAAKTHAALTEALQRESGIEQELLKAEQRRERQELRAPVAGYIQQLAVHTVGGVVTPAEKLMVLVPDDSVLEVEAMVLNKDVGFVEVAQAVEIKVESFPFTKYGLIPGTVERISADAVPDEKLGPVYPARIALHAKRILVGDRWVPLVPGMSVTAEVKTGKRRAIEFFLSPFMRYQDEALRER